MFINITHKKYTTSMIDIADNDKSSKGLSVVVVSRPNIKFKISVFTNFRVREKKNQLYEIH